MLAIAISLLFGVVAFAAVAVIHASVAHGARRAANQAARSDVADNVRRRLIRA